MSPRFSLLAVLLTASSAFAILPQAEPEDVLKCAASPSPQGICLASNLPHADRALLSGVRSARVLPFRPALWAGNWREYKLVGPTRTLYVSLSRGGTGPWQVARVSLRAEPRVLVSPGEFIGGTSSVVRASGLTPGQRYEARLSAPNESSGVPVAVGVARTDGTLELRFVAPNVRRVPMSRARSAAGTVRTVPARDVLLSSSELVVRLFDAQGREVTASAASPFRARLTDGDLRAAHEGQLHFRHLFGGVVHEEPNVVQVLELAALDALTVLEARRYVRAETAPTEENAYVRRLLTWHPDALRPFLGVTSRSRVRSRRTMGTRGACWCVVRTGTGPSTSSSTDRQFGWCKVTLRERPSSTRSCGR